MHVCRLRGPTLRPASAVQNNSSIRVLENSSSRSRCLQILAAKNKPQGQRKFSKGKSKSQGASKASAPADIRQQHKAPIGTERHSSSFIPTDRVQGLSSEPEQALDENPNFEDRLRELRQRKSMSQQQLNEAGTLAQRQESHGQASSKDGATADKPTNGQSNFWGRAAVGAGALALVGVFVLATVGVDLGLGGRRSQQSQSQVASLTPEQQKQLAGQAAQLEVQAESQSGSAEALAGAAGSYAALGNLDKSASLLEQLTAKSPTDAAAWQALGEVRLQQGRSSEGVAAYERALKASPNQTVALLQGLTHALAQAGRSKEAVGRLIAERDKASAPNANINAFEASMLLAKAYAAWPQHTSDALAVYDDLIQKSPQDFRAYLAKGLVLKGIGKIADAQRSFLQARYLSPPETRAAVDELAER